MTAQSPRIKWAPKVSPEKIRKLYESEAQNQLDEQLLDDVLIGLFLRCRSLLTVTAAVEGRVACPQCEQLIIRTEPRMGKQRGEEIIRCSSCGWETNWELYYRSYKDKQLVATNALPAVTAFVEQFDGAQSSRQKLMLIDRLIHAFHNELNERPNRPVAINVIDGRWPDVVMLILDLAYGDNPQMEQLRSYWREKLSFSTLPLGDLLDELGE